ncbi:hypothetical protein EB809_12810 [Marinobacter sp. R17]|uniref:hypothetical protein n=1 Tax=Marinobacter sp. R17 TaxID=2484250 RepID=UPI000F4C71A5|nr:hypothetical protein [Marinobacter sp. R17]ROT98927.1 hypothetical protein EB809_12810 [Marinobacter sp. R17]
MGFIAKEIEEESKINNISIKKIENTDKSRIIESINKKFGSNAQFPDPTSFDFSKKAHSPKFWEQTSNLHYSGNPVLGIYDRESYFWSFESGKELERLLSETTGFPFWITDEELSFLIYFDDHDCVHEAKNL